MLFMSKPNYAGFWVRVGASIIDTLLILPLAVILFWVYKSATPGKMMTGLRIIDARTGAKPTTTQFVLRYIGYYVSMIPLFLGILWVALDPKKQGWHDKIAGTVVVVSDGDSQSSIDE